MDCKTKFVLTLAVNFVLGASGCSSGPPRNVIFSRVTQGLDGSESRNLAVGYDGMYSKEVNGERIFIVEASWERKMDPLETKLVEWQAMVLSASEGLFAALGGQTPKTSNGWSMESERFCFVKRGNQWVTGTGKNCP